MPPFSPVFRRITRLGLQHGPGSFVNSLYQKRQDSIVRGFPQIYRVLRVLRVLRVIRVIIESVGQTAHHWIRPIGFYFPFILDLKV